MTAQQRRPGEGAADRAALPTTIDQTGDGLRQCRSCRKPEAVCDARHDACGLWCCPDCDHEDAQATASWAAPTPPPTGHVDPVHFREHGWCRHGCRRCSEAESRDDDASRHAAQVLRELREATPAPGPLLIELLHSYDEPGAS